MNIDRSILEKFVKIPKSNQESNRKFFLIAIFLIVSWGGIIYCCI